MATKKAEEVATLDTSTMNVWEKLSAVRIEFYEAGAKKSGKNLHAEFMYFELKDIVPIAEPLFKKYGLLFVPTFLDGNATALIVNTDKPEEHLNFHIPLVFIAEPGKFRMNEVQGVGAVVTYYRRYLYMMVLDLVESDGFDNQNNKKILEVHRQYDIPIIHANDSHYIYPEDAKYRDLFLKAKGIVYEEEGGFCLDYPDSDEIYRRYKEQGILTEDEVTEGGEDAGAEIAPIKTDKGYVTVTPAGGFIYDEAQSDKSSLVFTNTSLGANAAVYVYDEQSMEYEVQKKQFGYAYPNKEYTSVTIGANTYEAIESNTGVTYLVAKTSTGNAMYVMVWSCTVADATPLIETIVIS